MAYNLSQPAKIDIERQQPRLSVNQKSNVNNYKFKIENLHKMLDNQIQTVNTLFDKDNAFQQIQAKLKLLQVKLNSIKQDGAVHIQPTNHVIKSNKRDTQTKGNSTSRKQQKQQNLIIPFQSLSKYKKSKRKQEKQIKQNNRKSNLNQNYDKSAYQSGKKLNFDFDQLNQQNLLLSKKKQNKEPKGNKIQKVKSEKFISSKKRSKSSNQNQTTKVKNQISQPLSRHNSHKKHLQNKKRLSISKSQERQSKNKRQKDRSTTKKLSTSKTTTNLKSWKNIATIYGSAKNNIKPVSKVSQNQNKQKIKQYIRNSQTKKLHQELKNYKAKNQSLQNQVKLLKNYKQDFQKLKNVFLKQQKIRKNKRKF